MIRNLKSPGIASFRGKNTTGNLTKEALGTLISAENVMVLADQNVRRAPGYSLLFPPSQISATTAPVASMKDFQRSVDGSQYIIVQRGSFVYASKVVNGVPQTPVILDNLTSDSDLSYVTSSFICYASNGVDRKRFVDLKGSLTSYKWGIDQPTNPMFVYQGTDIVDTFTYAWDFGDSSTSAATNPMHTYASAGIYLVKLKVTNQFGQSTTAFRSIFIQPSGTSSTNPIPVLSGTYSGLTNNAIAFSAVDSYGAALTQIVSFEWNFGDGSYASGNNINHAYTSAGNYTLTLIVTDNSGNSTTVQASVIVRDAPAVIPSKAVAQNSAVIGSPFPALDGPYRGRKGQAVNMSAVASSDPNGAPLTYTWDFGDGSAVATGATVSHSYAAEGRYTVTLTVQNSSALYSSLQTQADVFSNMPNIADLQVPAVGTAGSPVDFGGSSVFAIYGPYLTYGRSYVYCLVSKYIDGLGIERIHVSAPSPINPATYTGPSNGAPIDLKIPGILVPSPGSYDPQVKKYWVFATADAPQDANATYMFLCEVGNFPFPAEFTDAYADDVLDSTRLAPFDNYPPPASAVLTRFQSRVFTLKASLMQYSGGPDTTLGIPDESFPAKNFYDLPAGSEPPNAIIIPNEGNTLAVSTGSRLIRFTGYDAKSFTQSDAVITPGSAGKNAWCVTPFGTALLSPSKRMWLWDGTNNMPMELSADVASKLVGTIGMDSINETTLFNARVHWFSYGLQHFILGIARTSYADKPSVSSKVPSMDWMSIWGVPLKGIGAPNAVYQTDKLPTHYPTCSGELLLNGRNFIMLGTESDGVKKFPDVWSDQDQNYVSVFTHAWFAPVEGATKFLFVDVFVDVSDPDAATALGGPKNFLQVFARVLAAPEDTQHGEDLQLLELQDIPCHSTDNASLFAVRASLRTPKTAFGRYIKVAVVLAKSSANISFDVAVQKIVPGVKPVSVGRP